MRNKEPFEKQRSYLSTIFAQRNSIIVIHCALYTSQAFNFQSHSLKTNYLVLENFSIFTTCIGRNLIFAATSIISHANETIVQLLFFFNSKTAAWKENFHYFIGCLLPCHIPVVCTLTLNMQSRIRDAYFYKFYLRGQWYLSFAMSQRENLLSLLQSQSLSKKDLRVFLYRSKNIFNSPLYIIKKKKNL